MNLWGFGPTSQNWVKGRVSNPPFRRLGTVEQVAVDDVVVVLEDVVDVDVEDVVVDVLELRVLVLNVVVVERTLELSSVEDNVELPGLLVELTEEDGSIDENTGDTEEDGTSVVAVELWEDVSMDDEVIGGVMELKTGTSVDESMKDVELIPGITVELKRDVSMDDDVLSRTIVEDASTTKVLLNASD